MTDCISRQAVLDIIDKWYPQKTPRMIKMISELPSVTLTERTGHWIEKDGYDGDTYYDCSECGESWTTIEGTPWDNEWNYCPNCGARMGSVE